ncbi:MAG: hypothetical protein ABJW53_10655 [Nonlabens ulvanivorans]
MKKRITQLFTSSQPKQKKIIKCYNPVSIAIGIK